MDGVKLQSKVYAGFGKAASVIGRSFDLYRLTEEPASTLDMLNPVATLPAQFTVNSLSTAFQRTAGPDDSWWDCIADGRRLIPGDVLVSADVGTYFIVSMQPLVPIKAVRCNATLEIRRPRAPTSPAQIGQLGYQGLVQTTDAGANGEDVLFPGIPCSIVTDGYGHSQPGDYLPGDSPGPNKWIAYLPPYVTQGLIDERDVAYDQFGNRFQIASANWGAFCYLLELISLQS